jgi:thioredoxin reductase (NADPH)
VEAALEIWRNGGRVTLSYRRETFPQSVKYWIKPDIENRIKAGQIRAMFDTTIGEITEEHIVLVHANIRREHRAESVFVLIGFGPDSRLLRDAGVQLDPDTLAPACNPETLETNVPALFVAGSVVAGKDTNRIFVENGRQHGDTIIRALLQSRTH